MSDVVDADLSRYFDSIPHDALLKSVARRIADGAVLRLIKQWLKAPIEERDEDGKRRMRGGKGNKRGTPQGGVVSPYMNYRGSPVTAPDFEVSPEIRLLRLIAPRSNRRDRCRPWRSGRAGSSRGRYARHSTNGRSPCRPEHSVSRPPEDCPRGRRVQAWRHQSCCWSSWHR